MVVAASTAERHAQQAAAECLKLLVDHIHFQVPLVLLLVVDRPENQIAGGGQQASLLLWACSRQQVACDLFGEKLVEGHVGIEGVDHIVAIPPGLLKHHRPPAPARLRKPRDVEPVAGHPLTKLRRFQQPVDHRCLRLAGAVFQKRFQCLGCGRQAGEVKGHPPQPGPSLGIGSRLLAGRFQGGQHKRIDLVVRPGGVGHGRQTRPGDRLKRPVGSASLDVDPRSPRQSRLLSSRIDRPRLNPGREIGHHRLRQPTRRRHLKAIVSQGRQEQALVRLAGRDRRPGVATGEQGRPGIHPQSTIHLISGMALLAVRDEHRANP